MKAQREVTPTMSKDSFKTTEYKFHLGHMKIQMSLHLEVLKNQPKVVKMTFKVHNKIIAFKVNNKLIKTMFQLKKKIIWLKI